MSIPYTAATYNQLTTVGQKAVITVVPTNSRIVTNDYEFNNIGVNDVDVRISIGPVGAHSEVHFIALERTVKVGESTGYTCRTLCVGESIEVTLNVAGKLNIRSVNVVTLNPVVV